jgi:hypothetical protein
MPHSIGTGHADVAIVLALEALYATHYATHYVAHDARPQSWEIHGKSPSYGHFRHLWKSNMSIIGDQKKNILEIIQ